MSFVRIGSFPVVGARIQPTELIFLFMLATSARVFGGRLIQSGTRRMWVAGGLYVGANLLSAGLATHPTSLLEAAGRGYLLLLLFLVALYVANRSREGIADLADKYLVGTMVLTAIAYVGYFVAVSGTFNSLVQVYGKYPYLGTVIRAKGLTSGAGMLVVVLIFPVLYAYREWRTGRRSVTAFAFLLPLALLTFSKEVVLISFGLLLVEPRLRRVPKVLRLLATAAVAVFFWAATHFILQTRQDFASSSLAGTQYTSGEVLLVTNHFQVIETSYTALKVAGVRVFFANPWFGVGPGNFIGELPALAAAGDYPEHLPLYDPHMTWLGALSETGLFGFGTLLIFCVLLFVEIRPILNDEQPAVPALFASLLLILILSMSKDVANFRFVWIMVALLLGLTWRKKLAV